jgi:cell division protein ZapA (FtsZ GTPase activity inhibitor)
MRLIYLQEMVRLHQEEDTQRYLKDIAENVDKRVTNLQIAKNQLIKTKDHAIGRVKKPQRRHI